METRVPMVIPYNAATEQPRTNKPVNLNVMKRNMSLAKGFMDISLLSANANQLKNLIGNGDASQGSYHLMLIGILASLILQVVTGVLLVVERFDINDEDDHEWSDRLNDITVILIFLVVVINVFVSSFGTAVFNPISN